MKTVYLVRHGESEGNVGPNYQGPDTPLSQKGREQSDFIAKRASRLEIEVLISSPHARTRETAEKIKEVTGLTPIYSDLFTERRRASEQIGKPKDDPKVVEIEKIWIDNFHNPYFRYADEENFNDLNNRAKSALDFILTRPESKIMVVTHGWFTRVLVGKTIFGEELTADACQKFLHNMRTSNTGLTILEYGKYEDNPRWQLYVYNDASHLG